MDIRNTYNFGDRHRFGITLELPQERKWYQGSYLRGAVCYWIFGHCIGDMQYGVSLSSDLWTDLEFIIKNKEIRKPNQSLFYADGNRIFQCYQEDYENPSAESLDLIKENQQGDIDLFDFWRLHRIDLELDIMEEYTIFLFDYDDQSRLVIGKVNPDKECVEFQSDCFLTRGEVDIVLQEAFDWLKKRYAEECEYDTGVRIPKGE